MLTAEDAVRLYVLLQEHNIPVRVCGGWGIDALLGRQTRPHKDLDVIMQMADVPGLLALLGQHGFTLRKVWEENLWVTGKGGERLPSAFVLGDDNGREVDAHALVLDEQGRGMPAWDAEGRFFEPEDLAARGVIGAEPVRCLSAACQLACHSGYTLPEAQIADVRLLREHLAGQQ